MKINKLMFAMLAGAMLASCSDDLGNEPAPENNAVGSTGYIGITIGMPSEVVSRGANDTFDDGLTTEYGVSGAVILFFTGPESNPDFYKAYNVQETDWNNVSDDPNQITSSNVVTFPVDFVKQSSGNLWALAVINPASVITVNADNTVKINGVAFTGDFKAFQALTTNAALYGENNFFMTNAPYSTVAGTTTAATTPSAPKFHVLARVNQDNIKPTLEEAQANPAANIFVERAVAKVEVNSTNLKPSASINFPDDEDNDFSSLSVTWILDNLEPTSYLVRNLEEGHIYDNAPSWALFDTNSSNTSLTHHFRFMGYAPFSSTVTRFRTYFGYDPHGVGINEGDNLLSNIPTEESGYKQPGSDHPQYCKENTFDVAHMDYRNTTRAVIRVNFGGDGGYFYTVGEDKKNVYYFETAASYLAQAILYDEDVVKAWTDYYDSLNEPYTNNATINDLRYTRTSRTAENDWMKITMETNTTTGRLIVKNIELKNGEGNALPPAITFNPAETIARVNANVTVKCYKDGVAYYSVLIRHFGNDLAPWTAPDITTNNTTESYGRTEGAIGPQDIQNYLGRYGVLRNNWYVITLGNINNIGEPVPGDLKLDGTPDDKVTKEESITCRINILSWAKRNQINDL